MMWLSDATLDHLRAVTDEPDLTATRYEIVEVIGRGGMGTVYRARDRELQREVALKVLQTAAGSERAAERLLHEARILAHLEHPGIVPVHDVGTAPDGRVFYVMKLVRGRRLDAHVRDLDTVAARLRIFDRICDAVAFAHAHGVIHRDLKPQNVMIGAFGEVLVLDWGVARLRHTVSDRPQTTPRPGSGPALQVRSGCAPDAPGRAGAVPDRAAISALAPTDQGTILGTPGYMPPEQARGEADRIDERTDVYALGAVLQFMLDAPLVAGGGKGRSADERPAGAASAGAASAGAASAGAASAGRLAVPRALTAIWVKAMSIDAADRYGSVRDLAAEVVRFQSGLAVDALPETAFDRIQRVFLKYRTPILLVLAYLMMRLVLLAMTGR